MSAVALDIGTYSIKAIEGSSGSKIHVKQIVEAYNTTGIAVPNDEGGVEKLGKLLGTVFTEHKLPTNDVRLSIPETAVSTKVISIPSLSDAELASAIDWQAEQYIPIPPEDLTLEYEVLYRPQKGANQPMKVLLVGVRKQVVERYLSMFHDLGIEPTILESQVLSLVRSLGFEASDPATLVVNLGASSMNLAVVTGQYPAFVLSHLSGGQLLNKALEQALGLDAAQAEQYKSTFGLDPQQFEGKVSAALTTPVNLLIAEMRKTVQFNLAQNPEQPVKRVVLTGGSALLPGLVQHVTSELGVEVLVAAPFANASGDIPSQINQPAMAICMGLLSRE
ncbi:type IV pilus assembly protein PilM [Candidatus Woesebacteria bacterium]|nr:type IV pilus assembly protein PilM [Candidatus Woesebacteria bacterium]